MSRCVGMFLALAMVVVGLMSTVSAADLSEYVQNDLVAVWDGYRNVGADKPHDRTSGVWYDTTGTYGFNLVNATFADVCCKFSARGSNNLTCYGILSADDTAATFGRAVDGTVEIVYSRIGYSNAPGTQEVLLQSSSSSGIAIGGTSTQLLTSNKSAPKYNYASFLKFQTVSVTMSSGVSSAVAVDGKTLSEVAGDDFYGGATEKTTLGNRAGLNAGFTGYIYAIRLYSRPLTDAERAQNAAADRERFFNRKLLATSSYSTVDTMAGVEADRTFVVDAETTPNAAHAAAVAWLAENVGQTAAVVVPAGTWVLSEPMRLVAGEKLVGAGRDKTFFDCSDPAVSDADCAVKLTADNNLVRGITVMNLVEITKVGTIPHAFYVQKGVLDGCRSCFHYPQYSANGAALLQNGGTVTNSLFDHVGLVDMTAKGLAVQVTGGLFTDSEICFVDTSMGRSVAGGGLYVDGAAAVVRNARIHDCGRARIYAADEGAGVYLKNGTIENSLVYGNLVSTESLTPAQPAGVKVVGGKMRYCTIVDNYTVNDTVGYSGLHQQGGDVRNCLISNNGGTGLGASVTGGTFVKNLVNRGVTGYDDNFATQDPKFADLGAEDFHIAAKASVAVGKAVPVAGVTTDADGVARDEEKPTIGAFEYIAQATEFSAEILVSQADWRQGDSPSVELVTDGVTDPSRLAVVWSVDGVEHPEAADSVEPSFVGLDLGVHDVRAVATYDGQMKEHEVLAAFRILPTTVYVNGTGRGEFPYASPETATNVLAVAYAALWKSVDETTRVEIAPGAYAIGEPINVSCPVVFTGAGRDATTLVGFASALRLITLDNDGAVLRNVTVRDSVDGGALDIVRGVGENLLLTNCLATGYSVSGAAVSVKYGRLLDSEIVDCRLDTTYGYGGGLALVGTGGMASNVFVRGCSIRSSHALQGGGVYVLHGLLANARIEDCGDHLWPNRQLNTSGGGLYVCGKRGVDVPPWGTVRQALVTRCSSHGGSVVFVNGGTLENCTFAANETAPDVAAVLLMPESNTAGEFYGVTMTNCVVWGNANRDFEMRQGAYEDEKTQTVKTYDAKVGYCCFPTAEEGVDGNTAGDPNFRGKARGEWRISSSSTSFRSGVVLDWMDGATDVKGNPRLTDGLVDRGCYQVGRDPGLMIFVR